MGKYIDITNKKFNRLVAIKFDYSTKGTKGTTKHFWLFRCDCGNIKSINKNSVTKGVIQGCGCGRFVNRTKEEQDKFSAKVIYRNYIKNAKKRKILFELTFDDFQMYLNKNCYYCNSIPELRNNKFVTNYRYNGLDRLDSNLGYTLINCVTCCSSCNYGKHTLNFHEFKEWIQKCYLNLFKNNVTIKI